VVAGAAEVIASAEDELAVEELLLEASVDESLEHAETPRIAAAASPTVATAFR
jgi:hypothetical protein